MTNKILVPLDRSELAEKALIQAQQWAIRDGSTIILLHIGTYMTAELRREAENYMAGQLARLERQGVAAEILLLEGDPAGIIIDVARQEGIKLIVMSTHGKSGLTRWMLGSVTERVLQLSPCPVFVVHDSRPIRNMMITLDGSAIAEQGFEQGMVLANEIGANVLLMAADSGLPVANIEETEGWEALAEQRQIWGESTSFHEASAYLDNLLAENPAEVPCETLVKIGPAAEMILGAATLRDIDLIVMTTHGRSGLGRWLYGSTTAKVMRGAECSLFVIRNIPAGE